MYSCIITPVHPMTITTTARIFTLDYHPNSASRRHFLGSVARASFVAAAGIDVPLAEAAGSLSGLSWPSGCGSADFQAFERYRDRKVDCVTCWGRRKNWSEAVQVPSGIMRSTSARISLGLAVLPDSQSALNNPGNWRL